MCLYDLLMLYNFRACSKNVDDNSQIIRIYCAYTDQHWINFGVYDFCEKAKEETIKGFFQSEILNREVKEIRQNIDVGILEVYLKIKEA